LKRFGASNAGRSREARSIPTRLSDRAASALVSGVAGAMEALTAFLPEATPSTVLLGLLFATVVYVLLEQLQFRLTCRHLPSPAGLFVPLVGGIVAMVQDPHGFWEKQRKLAPAGISKFFLLGKTVFFSTDTDTSRRILMNNGPESLMMVRRGMPADSRVHRRHRGSVAPRACDAPQLALRAPAAQALRGGAGGRGCGRLRCRHAR